MTTLPVQKPLASKYLFFLGFILVMFFMANNSKQVKGTEDSSFQQILTLINEVSGKQPNLRVDVQNLKLNIAKTKLTVNAGIDIKLPPAEVSDAKKDRSE